MSGKRQKLLDAILGPDMPIIFYRAVVHKVDANYRTCTVKLFGSDLEIEDVALVAEEDASQWAYLTPKVDSVIIVGCVNNDISNAFVAQFGDVEKGEILIGETKISFTKDMVSLVSSKASIVLDNNKATLTQAGTVIELVNGKISVKNGQVNLKTLFSDLTTLLKSFTVITAQGPSTGVLPTTLTSITQLETKVNALLS